MCPPFPFRANTSFLRFTSYSHLNNDTEHTLSAVPDVSCQDILGAAPWLEQYQAPPEADIIADQALPMFSNVSGDFMDVYKASSEQERWHAVVTSWLIDAVSNICELIKVIHGVLVPGGIWVNFGPLLYHWTEDVDLTDDSRFRTGIQLSWEEIKAVIEGYPDLTFLTDEWCDASYIERPASMRRTSYRCKFFSVRKAIASEVEHA